MRPHSTATSAGAGPQPSDSLFAPWLRRWNPIAHSEAIVTHGSWLLPVRREGAPTILKIAGIAAAELART